MKKFRLFAHRKKSATYQILTAKEAKVLAQEQEANFVEIDQGTRPYLTSKIKKLTNHVGQKNVLKQEQD